MSFGTYIRQTAEATMHTQTTEAIYRAKLAAFDWLYLMSDSLRVINAGKTAHAELQRLQRELDPDGAICNSYQPASPYSIRLTNKELP